MKISACVITKNEEKNIARSINSYKRIVDEIIVVDSESTDDTVRIAESLGAKVYTRPWTNDFAAARNFALDKATGDWIIMIDADEFFGDGQDVVIKDLIERAQREGKESIECPAYDIHENQNCIVNITHVQRIFQNDAQIRWRDKIHESIGKLDGSGMKAMRSDECNIYHTGYDPGIIKQKLLRNLKHLKLEDAMEEGCYKRFFMAECYYHLGEHEACIKELSYLFNAPEFEQLLYTSHKIFRIYQFQIDCMLKQKHKYSENEIAQYVAKSIEDFGKHPEIRQQEASYNMSYYRIDDAIKALEEAFRMQEDYDAPYENAFIGTVANNYKALSELYKEKHDLHNAHKAAFNAFRESKEDSLSWFFSALHGAETSKKHELAEKLLDTEDTDQVSRLIGEAWLSGNYDLFTDWLLILLRKHPELATDHAILCRIYLLQKNYAGVLDIADLHAGESMYETFALAAKLATGNLADRFEAVGVLSALEELLRAGAYEEAKAAVGGEMIKKGVGSSGAAGKMVLALLFEKYGQWEYGGGLYLDVAHTVMDVQSKDVQYINAARLFYWSGDWNGVLEVLNEALPFAPPGNHLPIEILNWVSESVKRDDKDLYRRIQKLKTKYEARYSITYDEPLPDRKKGGVEI